MADFLRQLLAPDTKAPRWFTAVVVVCLAVTAWWYVNRAIQHGTEVSAKIDKMLAAEREHTFGGDFDAQSDAGRPLRAFDMNDQRVYMNYAENLREHGLEQFTTRMRMPMYMWLLAMA